MLQYLFSAVPLHSLPMACCSTCSLLYPSILSQLRAAVPVLCCSPICLLPHERAREDNVICSGTIVSLCLFCQTTNNIYLLLIYFLPSSFLFAEVSSHSARGALFGQVQRNSPRPRAIPREGRGLGALQPGSSRVRAAAHPQNSAPFPRPQW